MKPLVRWAPKVPLSLIARVYSADADGRHDTELIDDLGWRLVARCEDVVLVSTSRVACAGCGEAFEVPWISEPVERVSACPRCGWQISSGAYHASFEHRDLLGTGATDAFRTFAHRFPHLTSFTEKMAAIDELVHAVHTTGGVAARNVIEGRARQVLAALDAISRSGVTGSALVGSVRDATAVD